MRVINKGFNGILRRLQLLSLVFFLYPVFGQGGRDSQGKLSFITRQGDKLIEGNSEFRFIGMNTPNLHVVEDNTFLLKGWHRIDEFEIRDAFKTICIMGGTVTRTYVFSVIGGVNNPTQKSHITGLRQYDEDMFKDFDLVLKLANEYGIRLIVPFIDNWDWWGGTMRFAAFRNKKQGEFCTDSLVVSDFKHLVRYVLERTNTYTGVKYKDDPAILAWETGNELGKENAGGDVGLLDNWTRNIAAYIKSIDRHHLVNDGKDCYRYGLSQEQLNDPYVDILTDHYYWGDYISGCKKSRERCKGKKVFYVGEFNHADPVIHEKLFNEVYADGTSGALVWSLRFHTKDGGFYYHNEKPDASNPCFRWPGFASAGLTGEAEKMKQVRSFAYKFRNLPEPALSVPDPPYLIPSATPDKMRWQGSAGATGYEIERSNNQQGKWITIQTNVTEDAIPYIPFNDKTAVRGENYYYRVKALNSSGASEWSNIIGPISF